jgi:hypothetical protein
MGNQLNKQLEPLIDCCCGEREEKKSNIAEKPQRITGNKGSFVTDEKDEALETIPEADNSGM